MLRNTGLLHSEIEPLWDLYLHCILLSLLLLILYKFDGLFSCHVVNAHFQHTKGLPFPVNGVIPSSSGILRRVLDCQLFNRYPLCLLVVQHTYLPKDNYASKIGRVFLWNDLVLVDYAERRFCVSLDCVQLMTAFCTMETDFITVIHIADGDGIALSSTPSMA